MSYKETTKTENQERAVAPDDKAERIPISIARWQERHSELTTDYIGAQRAATMDYSKLAYAIVF